MLNLRSTLYEFGGPPWCVTLRLIHLAFSPSDGYEERRIYALASDLLEDEAINAVIVLRTCTANGDARRTPCATAS